MPPPALLDMFRRTGGARCIAIGRQIQNSLADGLDRASGAKVASHLHACRRCGLTAEDYRRLKSALAETSTPMPADPLPRLQPLAASLATGDNPT